MKTLENNALYISDDHRLVYLYKPDEELRQALEEYDTEDVSDKILFVFGIKEENYMDAIWAQKGYGPIAYMLAMELQGEMAPYYMKSKVTPAAEKVWKEFFNGKGAKYVNKQLVGSDPKNFRNYFYSLKKHLPYKKNVKIDKEFINPDPYGEKRELLNEVAESILENSMNSIYEMNLKQKTHRRKYMLKEILEAKKMPEIRYEAPDGTIIMVWYNPDIDKFLMRTLNKKEKWMSEDRYFTVSKQGIYEIMTAVEKAVKRLNLPKDVLKKFTKLDLLNLLGEEKIRGI
jgi:hypothetical protein